MDELIKIAVGFGIGWVIVTVLAFIWIKARLTKSIEHEYAQRLEKYSADLKHQSEIVLKEFEAKTAERNIKLTSIFEKQAETILTIYKKLHVVKKSMYKLSSAVTSDDAKTLTDAMNSLIEQWHDFLDYYYGNKVLLTIETV
jgi:hypothetical protein